MVTGAIVAYVQDSCDSCTQFKRKHVGLLDTVTDGDTTFGESRIATFLVIFFEASSFGIPEFR